VPSDLPRPNPDRLSALTALVLLAFGLTRVTVLPTLPLQATLLGLVVRVEINTRLIMLLLAAGLAVAGADWLLRSHPAATSLRFPVEHWIIPGLAAFSVGSIVTRLPLGHALWLGLVLGAALLVAVLIAEFHVVDPQDPRHDAAAIGLRVLSYLFLVGAIFALTSGEMRAIFKVPLLFLATLAMSWRLLRLRKPRDEAWVLALVIGLSVAQLGWVLHYWPLPAVREALLLVLVVYLAEGLLLAAQQDRLPPKRVLEFGLFGACALGAILVLA
jgi:hypothetical protein